MIHTADKSTNGTARQSVGSLFRDLADESRNLLRQEVELAKAEMSEKAAVFGRNAAYLGVGALVVYTGVLALTAAACIGAIVVLRQVFEMPMHFALWLGPLAVGVIIALIGYAFVQKALSTFKKESFKPRNTIGSLRENKEWLHDQMTTSADQAVR